MGLIDDEIKELREMNQQLIDGKLNSKDCLTRLKIYKETAARQKMILDVFRVNALREIAINTGLVGEGKNLLSLPVVQEKKKEEDSGPWGDLDLGPRKDINSIPGPTTTEKGLFS